MESPKQWDTGESDTPMTRNEIILAPFAAVTMPVNTSVNYLVMLGTLGGTLYPILYGVN